MITCEKILIYYYRTGLVFLVGSSVLVRLLWTSTIEVPTSNNVDRGHHCRLGRPQQRSKSLANITFHPRWKWEKHEKQLARDSAVAMLARFPVILRSLTLMIPLCFILCTHYLLFVISISASDFTSLLKPPLHTHAARF